MNRFYPAFVSFLGSLGVALTLTYFGAVILSFSPNWDQLGQFMIGDTKQLNFGFLLVVVPYMLLLVNLFLRPRVGDWLLRRGEPELALAYASIRTKPTLRSARELTAHRLACVRASMMLIDYDGALSYLDFDPPKASNPFISGWARWGLELHLRREDLIAAREWATIYETTSTSDDEGVSFQAARMELAVRNQSSDAYTSASDSIGPGKSNDRTAYSRVLAESFEKISLDSRIKTLRRVTPEITKVLPGCHGEILALVSRLVEESGDFEGARAELRAAEVTGGDARSQYEISKLLKMRSPAQVAKLPKRVQSKSSAEEE